MKRNSHGSFFLVGMALVFGIAAGGSVLADDSSAMPVSKNVSKDMSSNMSPKDVCKKLVDAVKGSDFTTVKSYSARWGSNRGDHQQAGQVADSNSNKTMPNPGVAEHEFAKMHQDQMANLKNLSCGSEHVVGNHAVVEVDDKTEKRIIPFVMEDGKWKFDMRSYMVFYRQDPRMGVKSSG